MATVSKYWKRWVEKFPTLRVLANASLEQVNEYWAGLGYYRRAYALHECAKIIVRDYNGVVPRTAEELAQLPGIGQYTSGAIASTAYDQVVPIIDGNVARVMSRLCAFGMDSKCRVAKKWFWDSSSKLVDPSRPGDYNQGIMELGATICTTNNPKCVVCPIRSECLAHQLVQERSEGFVHSKTARLTEEIEQCGFCCGLGVPLTVSEYPVKPPKKKKTEMNTLTCVIVYYNKDWGGCKYLMIRRQNKGLLGGFWEFPSLDLANSDTNYPERKEKMDQFLESHVWLGEHASPLIREDVGTEVHHFTHIRQCLYVEFMAFSENVRNEVRSEIDGRPAGWFSKEQILTMAISKSVILILNLASDRVISFFSKKK